MKLFLVVIAWCILLVLCWPLALLALVVLPLLWLVALPFRVAFLCLEALLALVKAILFLPARLLGYRPRA